MDSNNDHIDNCINPNVRKLAKWTKALMTCLPLFKEYKLKSKSENKQKVKNIPNYVPKFGEIESVKHYPYKSINWKKLYSKSWMYK